MKKNMNWSYKHYYPFLYDGGDIHICRIVPDVNWIRIEWVKCGEEDYDIYYRKREIGEFIHADTVEGDCYVINDLIEGCEYEFYVRAGEKKSRIRLARCGKPFDTVVNYLHPEDHAYLFSGQYLASPSIVRHPDGFLLASMDTFFIDYGQNLTLIFRSDDDGKTWKYVCELFPCFHGKMFVHRDEVYMLAESTEYGDLLIGKSTDGGKTFTEPVVLLRGGGGKQGPGHAGVHKNPQPVVYFGGRIWNTMEWGYWGSEYGHAAMVMSAPEDSDLMEAANWTFSEPLKYSRDWEGVPKSASEGTIEGSLVEKDGILYNIMRYDMIRSEERYGLVLKYKVNTEDPDAPLEYEKAVRLPMNHAKFSIKYHERLGKYLVIGSRHTELDRNGRRLLSLMASDDLENWDLVTDIVDRRELGYDSGFQYVDYLIEGNKILYLCRTGINRPKNFHDSNYITFGTLDLKEYFQEL